MRAPAIVAAAALVVLLAAACGSSSKSSSSTTTAASGASSCTPDQLTLVKKGQLTVATDNPAFQPWFGGGTPKGSTWKLNDPTTGKGYESAVAYAVAKKLGYRHTRIFADHSVEIFNLNPSRLHTYMIRDQAVERVLRFVEITADEIIPAIDTQMALLGQR